MMLYYIKLFERKCLILATLEYSIAQFIQLIINKRKSLIITYGKNFLLDIKRRINGEFKIKRIFLSAEILFLIKKISFIKWIPP